MLRGWSGRLGLVGIILLLQSCSLFTSILPYHPLLPPTLQADPVSVDCLVEGEKAQCLIVMQKDWEAVVITLKQACLQTGGSAEQCQTMKSSP